MNITGVTMRCSSILIITMCLWRNQRQHAEIISHHTGMEVKIKKDRCRNYDIVTSSLNLHSGYKLDAKNTVKRKFLGGSFWTDLDPCTFQMKKDLTRTKSTVRKKKVDFAQTLILAHILSCLSRRGQTDGLHWRFTAPPNKGVLKGSPLVNRVAISASLRGGNQLRKNIVKVLLQHSLVPVTVPTYDELKQLGKCCTYNAVDLAFIWKTKQNFF